MIFKKMPGHKANELIDWAEENDVDWDVWNAEETMTDQTALWEIGLERWPDNVESTTCR